MECVICDVRGALIIILRTFDCYLCGISRSKFAAVPQSRIPYVQMGFSTVLCNSILFSRNSREFLPSNRYILQFESQVLAFTAIRFLIKLSRDALTSSACGSPTFVRMEGQVASMKTFASVSKSATLPSVSVFLAHCRLSSRLFPLLHSRMILVIREDSSITSRTSSG